MASDTSTLDIPEKPAVRRAWVIYQLRRRNLSLRDLAERHGVSAQAMSAVFTAPNSHLEIALARALGVKVVALFPERFDASGRRLHRTRAAERSSARCARNPKRPEAA